MVGSLLQDPAVTRQRLPPGTVRRIAGYARPYRFRIVLFIVMTCADAATAVATPLLFREIIDRGIAHRDETVVVVLTVLVGVIALLAAVLGMGQAWMSAWIGEGLIYDLRCQIFRHVQRQPVAFFARTQTGALVSRLNTDVVGAQQALTGTLASVVQNLLTVALIIGVMSYLSWPVTLVALGLVPLFALPARATGRRLRQVTLENMQLNADMGATMTERFGASGAAHVWLYGRPDDEARSFGLKAARVRDIGVKAAMYGQALFVTLTLVASLGTAALFGIGGSLAVHGDLQIGTVMALVILLSRLYAPITGLSNVQVEVMTALVSFDRVFEVLDLEPQVREKPAAVPLVGSISGDLAPDLEFDHVTFRYPAAAEVSLASLEAIARPTVERDSSWQALTDVSFRVPPGRMTALVGPSGAGKTTIASLTARLYDVTSGAVRIGSHDIRDVTLTSLHQAVGLVTQEVFLLHDSIRANLAYARPEATENEQIEACRAACIWDLIASLPDGLDTVVGDRGFRLSGGERQRLAIARLLLKQPAVVVLDEATAHLDSESETALQEAMRIALAGRTSLVIAHRLATVRQAAEILVLDAGTIVERGTHQELLAGGGLYGQLYRTQFAPQAVAEAV
jgi:ATP-binding cassette subfamily B protein